MEDGVGAGRTGEGVDIVGRLVEAVAGGLSRARATRTRRFGRLDVEVVLPERAVSGVAVDVGAIVEDLAGDSVLELGDGRDSVLGGNLQRDTARGWSVVDFAVAATRRDRGRRLRVSLSVYGPEKRVKLAMVDDDGASLGGDCSSSGSKGRDGRGNFHRGCQLKLVLVGCSL